MSAHPAAPKTWLITGCSSGLGRLLAESALARGDNVVATARDTASLVALIPQHAQRMRVAVLDVTRPGDAARAVAEAVEAFGHIDILVNNAGYGLIGAVEEIGPDEYRPLFETNVFGAIEVTRAALPIVRKRPGGRIVQISSNLGLAGRAGYGLYSASKFALEGLSEALANEVAPFGIAVIIVEPGAFRTEFLGRSIARGKRQIAAYDETSGAARTTSLANAGKQRGDPKLAVQVILKAVDSQTPPLRLALGPDAHRNIRAKLEMAEANLASWEEVASATDFPNV